MCAGISWAGAKDLDKFVAFVGSFAWWVLLISADMYNIMFADHASR